MRKTKNILYYEVLTSIIISLIVVIGYETDLLPTGVFAADGNIEFVAVSLMEVVTICSIPLALRLFKFKKISGALVATREKGLLKWGSIRMMMLCVPMMINTLLYYLFMNVAFGYMGIIGLICLAFIWPSMNRCVAETGGER